jgi:hypothetical protein
MVSWSEIEAECGGYREGFVAVFRKYEGQATDEKDAKNRTVKVTASSFARHVGIPEQTFRRWVSATAQVVLPEQRTSMDMSKARKMLRDAPAEVVSQLSREERQKLSRELDRSLTADSPLRHHPAPTSETPYEHAYVIAEGELARARSALRAFIEAVRGHEWIGEEAELLGESIARTKQLFELAGLAVEGTTSVDWDAELENLMGGAA